MNIGCPRNQAGAKVGREPRNVEITFGTCKLVSDKNNRRASVHALTLDMKSLLRHCATISVYRQAWCGPNWQFVWPNSGNDAFETSEAVPEGKCCRCGRLTGQSRRRCQSGQLRLKLGRAFIRAHHAFKFGKPSAIE